MNKRSGSVLLACLTGLALSVAVVGSRLSRSAVYHSVQPSSVVYHSHDPYMLTINERGFRWNTFPLSRRYEIFIGRAADTGYTYGYGLDYSFHPGSAAGQPAVGEIHVAWSASGVTLTEESGQRVFVPRALFTGGR